MMGIPLFLRVVGFLVALYLVLEFAVPVLPRGIIIIYMIFALLGVLLYITVDEKRMEELLDFFREVPAAGSSEKKGKKGGKR